MWLSPLSVSMFYLSFAAPDSQFFGLTFLKKPLSLKDTKYHKYMII